MVTKSLLVLVTIVNPVVSVNTSHLFKEQVVVIIVVALTVDASIDVGCDFNKFVVGEGTLAEVVGRMNKDIDVFTKVVDFSTVVEDWEFQPLKV